jgi:hypothetical protein
MRAASPGLRLRHERRKSMPAIRVLVLAVSGLVLAPGLGANAFQKDGEQKKKAPREALRPLSDLVGEWRAVGTPTGTREEQEKGAWDEKMFWEWKFKGDDAWMTVAFKDSKHFASGDMRYDPAKDRFTFTVKTPGKDTLTFTGEFTKEKVLTLERDADKEVQRLVFTFLHSNRFLYRMETKPQGKVLFAARYKVGATKEGEPFAAGDGRPECIVSGGLGTIAVSHKGTTYYVCCSGCRDEFNANPEKYVKELEAKKGKKK